MPHLVLASTTSEPDASRNKTTSRRLRMWLNGKIEEVFKEQRQRNQYPTKEQEIFSEISMHTCLLGKSEKPYRELTTVKKAE